MSIPKIVLSELMETSPPTSPSGTPTLSWSSFTQPWIDNLFQQAMMQQHLVKKLKNLHLLLYNHKFNDLNAYEDQLLFMKTNKQLKMLYCLIF